MADSSHLRCSHSPPLGILQPDRRPVSRRRAKTSCFKWTATSVILGHPRPRTQRSCTLATCLRCRPHHSMAWNQRRRNRRSIHPTHRRSASLLPNRRWPPTLRQRISTTPPLGSIVVPAVSSARNTFSSTSSKTWRTSGAATCREGHGRRRESRSRRCLPPSRRLTRHLRNPARGSAFSNAGSPHCGRPLARAHRGRNPTNGYKLARRHCCPAPTRTRDWPARDRHRSW